MPSVTPRKDTLIPSMGSQVRLAALVASTQVVCVLLAQLNSKAVMNFTIGELLLGIQLLGSSLAVILLLAVALISLALAWTLRGRRSSVATLTVAFTLSIAVFSLSSITVGSLLNGTLNGAVSLALQIAIPSVIVLLLVDNMYAGKTRKSAPALLLFVCAELGSYFALTLTTIVVVPLITAFAVFDLVAVLWGPLRDVDTDSKVELVPTISAGLGGLALDLGDLTFYSMLPAVAWVKSGIIGALSSIIAINLGVFLTIMLLRRWQPLPGLPIPMALGVITLFLIG